MLTLMVTEKDIISVTTFEHIRSISCRLRDEEIQEVIKMGHQPLGALRGSFINSKRCYTWLRYGKPLLVVGISQYSMFDSPTLWLASSKDADKYRVTLIRNSILMLKLLSDGEKYLSAHIDATLKSTLKWIRKMGFTIKDAEPIEPFGYLFHFCYKEF